MSAYHYQALKSNGRTTKGVIEADSEWQARQKLREQGLIPTTISSLKKPVIVKHRNKLAAADLALFTRQLATLLAAGIPIDEALRGVASQSEKDKVRQLIIGVRTKVVEGYALAQALAEYPFAFPELYRATVAAGEHSGRLDMVLEKLADYTETQQATKQKIQHALMYPSIMITVSIAIVSFLLAFVVPKIIDVFAGSGQTLPLMTTILIHISNFIKTDGIYVVIGMMLIVWLLKRGLTYPKFRKRWDSLMLKLPITAYLVKSINVARYIHTFAILFAAGVNVLETMRVAASLVNNTVMREAFDNASTRVREGTGISLALKDTGYLGAMATHLIASGEKSGQIAPMMERSALHLDNEVRRLIDTALTLLEPLVILCMGGIVLFIVLATLLPIFSMEQLVS